MTNSKNIRTTATVLGANIDAISWDGAINRIIQWANIHSSRYVAICNAHVVVTTSGDAAYRGIINTADMATPDGAPVAWMLKRQGFAYQERINGPDLMWRLCDRAEKENLNIYCFGSTDKTLSLLLEKLNKAFPNLSIKTESPPFRALSPEEDVEVVNRINNSHSHIVFVGLGCPKQEYWMANHRGRVNAVMLGVGAAFDFHAGTVARSPVWMREHGLEWLHRLISEPKRLWRRYFFTNTLFVIGAAKQLLLAKRQTRSE